MMSNDRSTRVSRDWIWPSTDHFSQRYQYIRSRCISTVIIFAKYMLFMGVPLEDVTSYSLWCLLVWYQLEAIGLQNIAWNEKDIRLWSKKTPPNSSAKASSTPIGLVLSLWCTGRCCRFVARIMILWSWKWWFNVCWSTIFPIHQNSVEQQFDGLRYNCKLNRIDLFLFYQQWILTSLCTFRKEDISTSLNECLCIQTQSTPLNRNEILQDWAISVHNDIINVFRLNGTIAQVCQHEINGLNPRVS